MVCGVLWLDPGAIKARNVPDIFDTEKNQILFYSNSHFVLTVT